jgi:D-alanyl-D-alanine dipeptidase
MSEDVLRERWDRVRYRAADAGADAILLAGGPDLAYLTGYEAMPLERITAFVGLIDEAEEPPWLIVPTFEIPRVQKRPGLYTILGWGDSTDPVEIIARCLPETGTVLVSDDLWAMHVINLGLRAPRLSLEPLGRSLGGIRTIKAPTELAAIAAAGALADEVARQLQDGAIPLVGRSEATVAADIAGRLLGVGHDSVEFVIVASGPNSASPHHHPGERVIEPGEMVLCDFGGKLDGYCSDTTRCVWTGQPPEEVRAAYDALRAAQESAVRAVQPGNRLSDVDRAARNALRATGYGEYFIHRTGHGIGTEVHEHPYITEHNTAPIEIGHAFSVEPGIYLPDRWGMRIEDIVIVQPGGGWRCNNTSRELAEV